MQPTKFFDESREQSEVKTAIVTKYFDAWARVVIPWARKGSNKIAYIDLFAGPGRYIDGTKLLRATLIEHSLAELDEQAVETKQGAGWLPGR
jgi:three-Cys-motif partner protein